MRHRIRKNVGNLEIPMMYVHTYTAGPRLILWKLDKSNPESSTVTEVIIRMKSYFLTGFLNLLRAGRPEDRIPGGRGVPFHPDRP